MIDVQMRKCANVQIRLPIRIKFLAAPLLIVLIVFMIAGCMPPDPGIWKNNQIKSGDRDHFHELNAQLFKAIKAGNVHDVEDMMSQQMLDDNSAKRKIDLIGNRLKTNEYSIFDEYYIVHQYIGDQTIKTDTGHLNDYKLHYQSVTREMYVGLFLPKSGADQYMISVIYAKYKYGWRIYFFDVQQYTTTGKNAPALYNLAKQQYAQGYLMKALNTMKLSRDCAIPVTIWLYRNDGEMDDFYRKLITEAGQKYRFPVFISNVPGVEILGVDTQPMNDGPCPAVSYITKVSVNDTNAVKKENLAIQKAIGKVFPGIDVGEKYIYYTAFNHLPKGKKGSPPYFDITQKLK